MPCGPKAQGLPDYPPQKYTSQGACVIDSWLVQVQVLKERCHYLCQVLVLNSTKVSASDIYILHCHKWRDKTVYSDNRLVVTRPDNVNRRNTV